MNLLMCLDTICICFIVNVMLRMAACFLICCWFSLMTFYSLRIVLVKSLMPGCPLSRELTSIFFVLFLVCLKRSIASLSVLWTFNLSLFYFYSLGILRWLFNFFFIFHVLPSWRAHQYFLVSWISSLWISPFNMVIISIVWLS